MPTARTTRTLDKEPESWRPLLQTAQQWEVQDARNVLESRGIPAVVEVDHFSGTYFEPFYQKHRLYVPNDRVTDATDCLEDTAYEKFLLDREADLENVSNWRYRDVLLLASGFLIGIVDWVVLYGLHILDFIKRKITAAGPSTDES